MELTPLTAVSPIDGRYRGKCDKLDLYFSEYALIRYRVRVEVEYFIALCRLPLPQLAAVGSDRFESLRAIYRDFSLADAARIKEIESVTNHDVKAVEYFLKEQFDAMGLEPYKEFIHFGLTSQDINNTSVPMSIREAIHEVYLPELRTMIDMLEAMSEQWKDVAMLARTHGQPASPTRLGKELGVFVYRLRTQMQALESVAISGKFGGATGNFNAHHAAYPSIDWKGFAARFLSENLGIEREELTTQISNYDNLAALFDAMRRINTIMIDLDRDIWQYISMDYFKQRIKAGEVGSSAMPHKVFRFAVHAGAIGAVVHVISVDHLLSEAMTVKAIESGGHCVSHETFHTLMSGKVITTRENHLRIFESYLTIEEITVREIRVNISPTVRPSLSREIAVGGRSDCLRASGSLIVGSVDADMIQFISAAELHDVATGSCRTSPLRLIISCAEERLTVLVDELTDKRGFSGAGLTII